MAPATDPSSRDSRYLVTGDDRCESGYFTQRDAGSHDYLVIYTVRGRGLYTHASGTFDSRAHDVVLIEPGRFHRYEVHPDTKQWQRLWAHFVPPPTWTIWLQWPTIAPGFRKLTLRDRRTRQCVTERLREAHRIMSSYVAHREPLALNALEAALLWCDERNPQADRARLDPRVREGLDYLCRHLDQPIPLDALAEHCGLSASRLAHLFREQVGMTPVRFLETQRMRRARQLLEVTGMSVAEVGYEVGYDNPFYFSCRFKKATGKSPRQYRDGHVSRVR
jgi:AraC family transcriptional regulator of arabinose operon